MQAQGVNHEYVEPKSHISANMLPPYFNLVNAVLFNSDMFKNTSLEQFWKCDIF